MSFLHDYLQYNENNESPRNYHLWSAFVILAAASGLRVFLTSGRSKSGYFEIRPNLYVGLIGKQGSRKSIAKDIAESLFADACPDLPIGASVESLQAIVKAMASDDSKCYYEDENKAIVEYRPRTFFINELKNFLSVNPAAMIDFLTDIYDRKVYNSNLIVRGVESIKNPCVNILACETPKWIINNLKMDIISGGFSRRMVYVYELDRKKRVTFPEPPEGWEALYAKMKNHLSHIRSITGQFKWTSEALEFYDRWYQSLVFPDDEIMAGYYESKHIQLQKVGMLWALAEYEPKLVLTRELLEKSLAALDAIEENLPKLSAAAGRNELAIPTQHLLEILEKNGGCVDYKRIKIEMGRELDWSEFSSVLRFLKETDQIVAGKMKVQQNGTTTEREVVMTMLYYTQHGKATEGMG